MDWLSFLRDFFTFFTFFLCIANTRRIYELRRILVSKSEPIEMDATEFKKWLDEHTKDSHE